MGKKYLDTKEGSLEQSILGLWEKAAVKQEKLVGGQKKLDKDKDGDIDGKDFAMLRKSKKKDKKEEVELDEGKMSQLHQLIKDKKSAEEIAKIMRVDVKTIKKLMAGYMSAGHMPESYEIGTNEYRKHTENVTPGEDGEWVDAVKKKNESMREALAKVWNATEDKNPFKKEGKKDLTKEVKDGKTMTGKKVASVDVNPKIMEKKK
jgi:hypothetical protein